MPDSAVAWLVAGVPGSGKTTLGRAIAVRTGAVLLDLDVLTNPLLAQVAAVVGAGDDLDHAALRGPVRAARYRCLLDAAVDNLRLGRSVVLVAPFSDEVRDASAYDAVVETLTPATPHPALDAPAPVSRDAPAPAAHNVALNAPVPVAPDPALFGPAPATQDAVVNALTPAVRDVACEGPPPPAHDASSAAVVLVWVTIEPSVAAARRQERGLSHDRSASRQHPAEAPVVPHLPADGAAEPGREADRILLTPHGVG